MGHGLTVTELEQRWENALIMTRAVVAQHPGVYAQLKSLARGVIAEPLDIREYLPTMELLLELLDKLDPGGRGSIFHFFHDRMAPSGIRDVRWLRMDCRDLLAHLKAFDEWRRQKRRLQIVK